MREDSNKEEKSKKDDSRILKKETLHGTNEKRVDVME